MRQGQAHMPSLHPHEHVLQLLSLDEVHSKKHASKKNLTGG